MYQKLPIILITLLSAMLIGLVGHGYELFEKVEGTGVIGYLKALGFPLALEVGNAAGLYVLASHMTKSWYTRLIGGIIGVVCLGFSFLMQYNYYKLKIDFDLLYSFALPGLAALIALLIGFLDKDNSEPETITQPVDNGDFDQGLLQDLRQALENHAKNQDDFKARLVICIQVNRFTLCTVRPMRKLKGFGLKSKKPKPVGSGKASLMTMVTVYFGSHLVMLRY
jgi:hypothetical protein